MKYMMTTIKLALSMSSLALVSYTHLQFLLMGTRVKRSGTWVEDDVFERSKIFFNPSFAEASEGRRVFTAEQCRSIRTSAGKKFQASNYSSLYHLSSLAFLFLCIPHTSHAMETTQKNISNPSDATHLCLQGIAKNDTRAVRDALLADADVNYINSDGKSLFYLASERSINEEIYQLLITHENIDTNSRTSKGCTPLHVACELGLTTTVTSMLSKAPQAANISDKSGNIPLQIAAGNGKEDCVKLLLSHDTRTINHQNYNGSTALHMACSRKQLNVIKLLIEKDANPTIKSNNYQTTPLIHFFSAYNDDLNLFYSFIADNPFIASKLIHTKDTQKNSQLHLCAVITSIVAPKFELYLPFLTSHGLNIHSRNKDGKRAVDLACEKYTKLYNFYTIEKSPTIQSCNQSRTSNACLSMPYFTPYPMRIIHTSFATIKR